MLSSLKISETPRGRPRGIFNNCLYIGNLGYNGGTAGSSLTTTSGVGVTKIGGEYFP